MKIGILTFHSQLNYGGVLQCYALQSVLQNMGHDVFVIDRWLDENNTALEGIWGIIGKKAKIRFVLKTLLLCGTEYEIIRRFRTKKFIKRFLNLTSYHFVEWENAPADIKKFDCLVVGSDQVWHIEWPYTKFYFLSDSYKIPAIAYAASIGMDMIPKEMQNVFSEGIKRFTTIGVREGSAKQLINSLGFDAVHVADPVLLASPEIWNKVKSNNIKNSEHKRVFCYFMEYNIFQIYQVILDFTKRTHDRVDIFLNSFSQYQCEFPKNLFFLKKWIQFQKIRLTPNIHIHLNGGPKDFINYISSSSYVITDSFHALMFSVIFKKNVCVLKPQNDFRRFMFSRIKEIENHFIDNTIESDSLEEALLSVEKNERTTYRFKKIDYFRQESFSFLNNSFEQVPNSHE